MPGTRAIALRTALLLATAAFACSIAVGGTFLLLTLVVASGHAEVALHDSAWAVWCGAAAGACGMVAALIALTRSAGGLRPLALAAAWAIAFAWPPTGATPAALAALVAIGFVVRWGASGTRRRPRRPAGRDRARRGGAGAPQRGVRRRAGSAAAGRGPRRGRFPCGDAGPAGASGARCSPRRGRASARRGRPHRRRRGSGRRPPASSGTTTARWTGAPSRAPGGGWIPPSRPASADSTRWRAGFATTRSSRPRELRVVATGDGAVVEHVLVARDEAACGVLVQRFSVRWRLRRTADGWRAAELAAAALGSACT